MTRAPFKVLSLSLIYEIISEYFCGRGEKLLIFIISNSSSVLWSTYLRSDVPGILFSYHTNNLNMAPM